MRRERVVGIAKTETAYLCFNKVFRVNVAVAPDRLVKILLLLQTGHRRAYLLLKF